jgi:NADH:ubiquinone oxidoreductase subunit 3 (subunit A)
VGYYVFAILFVVFDIDTVFLAPWALVLRHLPAPLVVTGLVEGLVFVALLAVALVYAVKRGVLKWT